MSSVYMTTAQAAERLQYSYSHFVRVLLPKLPGVIRNGKNGAYRIPVASLVEFERKHLVTHNPDSKPAAFRGGTEQKE